MATSTAGADPMAGSAIGLFTNQIVKFVILAVGCIFSVIIGMQVTSSDANGLATFMRYVAAATFLLAVVSPRTGVYMVLFICPVLDLIKRTLILFDTLSMTDVASVLALSPVTLAGAITGLFFNRFVFRRLKAIPGEGTLFAILLAITSFIAVTTALHTPDSKLMLLRSLAESCVYLCLILLIPVYFPTTEDIAKLLRWCVVVFVPVALYGFWQHAFGLSEFEWRYLMSGLTLTSADFLLSERVFSTLNSNHSFSVTMACCAVISLLQRWLPSSSKRQDYVKNYSSWLFVLFCAATVVSLRRTGWLVVIFSLAGAFCFRTRFRTLVFYSVCLLGGFFIIFNAQYIYTKLPGWEANIQMAIPGYDHAFQLQTFNDRLNSFQTLRENSAIWTLFGLAADQRDSVPVHDAIGEALVSYGVVGLLAFIAVLVQVLSVAHRLVWKATNPSDRSYTALLLSFIFANLFVGALMQSHINIFPINFIFWMCVGALLKITFNQQPIVEIKPKIDPVALATMLKAKQPIKMMGRYALPGD